MINKLSIAIIFALIPSFTLGVPGEGVATTVAVKAQTAMQKIEYQLMRVQMVQQTKWLWDNYVQAKKYYDSISAASKNRGGLLGYYHDKFKDRLNQGIQEEWFKMQQLREGSEDNALKRIVDGNEAYAIEKVNNSADRLINGMDNEVAAMVNVVNKSTEKSNKRFDMLVKLADQASKPGISDKTHDSLILEAQILQLEFLASIDQNNQALFSERVRQLQREMKIVKSNQNYAKELISLTEKRVGAQGNDRYKGKITEDQIISVLNEGPK